ncbi:MAG TPA: CPBP family glutamic-type intramembrane protease [Nitrososphaeraceae archaeon]|nr:CPBP family glutamic-type intramembrane protease [Nitrososphaeraceae archaeon]
MFLFYHGIGIISSSIGTIIIDKSILEYEEPNLPLSMVSVILAGPLEESLFFGIPFYAFGNNLVVLFGGIAWAMLHIFNTYNIDVNQLSYANWLFVIPSLFFSLRTWLSGKGWFAILGHSLWNLLFFTLSCIFEEISCSYGFEREHISISLLVGILLTIVYLLMKRRHEKIAKK